MSDSEAEVLARHRALAQQAAARRADEVRVMRTCRFDTIAVHGLYSLAEAMDFNQGAMIEPIYMSTSQGYRDSDEMEAALAYQIPTWGYARIGNPSLYYLEAVLALLEGYGFAGETSAHLTASGMAAIFSATEPFLAVDPRAPGARPNFVASAHVYGGTFQLFSVRRMQERGIEVRWVADPTDLDAWAERIDAGTRFLYGELPSNPGLRFFDTRALADLAHSHDLPLIVDSTVATPALFRPLQHGADIVVQSVSKTIAASGFAIAGAVIARHDLTSRFGSDALRADFAAYLKGLPNRDIGPNLSPFHAALALADVRTLRSKVDLFSRSSMRVAQFLQAHPGVEGVEYLGLPEHPHHALAARDMWLVDAEHDDLYGTPTNRFGHLLSFRVRGGGSAARRVFDKLQRIWRATDLGRIKTVAAIPAISTHSQQGEAGRALAGIPDNLIRLAVGGEHPDDIIADLEQALAPGAAKVAAPSPFSVGGASRRPS